MSPRFLTLAAVLLATACRSSDPLAGTPLTDVNFYTASLALANASVAYPPAAGSACCFDYIYVDTFDTTHVNDPYFTPGIGVPYPVDPVFDPILGLEHVNFQNFPSGTHRFRFTDNTHTVIADTTLSLATGHRTMVYLNDSLSPSHYRVMALDETGTVAATGIRVRVINFSPDEGPVSVYVLGDTGQFVFANLPQQTPFDSVTPYVALDSSLALADGNIYLKFFAGTDTASTLATAIVPAASGRSYHVIFEGNASVETLTYPNIGWPNQQTQLQIAPRLSARVREIY